MKLKHEEQQPSQTNASNLPKENSNLIERKQIEGTPFTMIKQIMDNEKEKYFIVMGEYKLTEPTNTEEETLEKIITEHWKIMTTVICIIVDKLNMKEGPLFGQYKISENNFTLPNGMKPTKEEWLKIKTELEKQYETESL